MVLDLRAPAARNLSLLLRHASRRTTAQFLRHHSTAPSSVSSDELTHFASLASSWWDPLGPSRVLHLMNPLRHEFIQSCLSEGHSRTDNYAQKNDHNAEEPKYNGLRYLDIGCGGGIFAESLARTIPLSPSSSFSPQTAAASLLAIDPSPVMIEIALSHARKDPTLHSHLQSGNFKYESTTLEALVSRSLSTAPTPIPADPSPSQSPTSSKFDIITLFEVLEHIDPSTSSPRQFIENCLRLLQPRGWLIGSTIARTWPSYIINQVLAEAPWPIGVVPRGTHEWSKFVNEDELRGWAAGSGKADSAEAEAGSSATVHARSALETRWKCVGAMYFPGLGWKLVPGSEKWGNYFWGIQKLT
ncbi:Hexaprenyldihydroxybenzoate methyltransferase, mitochondrial [Emydomyces testavorans]|uniref:Ubiquinone biosynthesis O-methyltransferase, mitochondrial n=1 Tax=Emydomyces testavorans TaxID=2070801 RepID=A0AAF0IH58_9EURO|nr:Hexaprenyldihydroxybenzoate methyltransferase, mitochondrial [Emydomyces testavorans]